jgi:ubiquinone/menaquinone biosynthesis C-methylase UbiE
MTGSDRQSSDVSARYDVSARSWDASFSDSALNHHHVAACWRAFAAAAGGRLRGQAIELGVGTGLFTVRLAARFDTITAVDFSAEMLRALQAKLDEAGIGNVTCHHGDATNLEAIGDESADFVYCFGLLENISDPRPLFAEVHRVLRRGGRFVGTVSNRACPWYGLRRLLIRDKWFWNEARLYRAEELLEAAREAGFVDPRVSGWGLIPSQFPTARWLAPVAAVERMMENSPLSRYLGGLAFRFDRA